MTNRGFKRQRRAYFWMGQQNAATVNLGTTSIDLYDPSQASIEDSKSLRLEHVVVWMSFISTTSTTSLCSFALQHLPSDISLVAQNVIDPASTDLDFFNKKQLVWGGAVGTPVLGQQPLLIYERIRAKRRMDAAQDWLSMTLSNSDNTNTTRVSWWIRALFSKPA